MLKINSRHLLSYEVKVNTLLDILDPFYETSWIETSLKLAAYIGLSLILDLRILLK